MIRVGLPAPILLRWRLRAQLSARRISRQAQEFRQEMGDVASRPVVAVKSLLFPGRNNTAPISRETFLQFEDRYQNLIDLLCWSAHGGVTGDEKQQYADLRRWFLTNYDTIRPALGRYLMPAGISTDPGVDSPAPRDDFESLFWPLELDSLINSDTVIDRIQRTRGAVEACRQALAVPV